MTKFKWIFLLLLFIPFFMLDAQEIQHKKRKIYREDTEWANFWMEKVNNTDLPHILLIGNSITQRYSEEVANKLRGKAYCSKLTTSKSLGDPAYLTEVELALQHNTFDVIHFNNGLHGHEYSEVDYISAFPELLALFKKYAPNAKLIWATITPVRNKQNVQKLESFNDRVIERNKLVLEYLNDEKIIIDDLYSIMINHPEYYDKGDGIHPNKDGVKRLSEQVYSILLNAINSLDNK